MCRHASYVGPAIAIDSLTHQTPHGLVHQSHAARELLTGTVCADGFGVGWFDESVRPEPARYANPAPIWSDASFPSFGPLISSSSMMAAVRNATEAGHNTTANCAPFAAGNWLFSLNGFLQDFPSRWHDELRSQTAPNHARNVAGNTDAEWMFAAIRTRIDTAPTAMEAVQGALRDWIARADSEGLDAQLNILLQDGRRVIAARAGNQPQSNSLYVLRDGADFPGGFVVASEPLDDGTWEPIADGSLLLLEAGAPPVRLSI